MPFISTRISSFTPKASICLAIAIPAAPAPFITTVSSLSAFPVTLLAFISAADTTTAVPCWSSWKTGMSSFSFSLASISKHLGAEISSRFIPPKLSEISSIVLTISSTSLLFMQSGNASTSANSLKSAHLPSITGIPARPPMLPSPSTAEPSVITATRFDLLVSL